MAEMRKGEGIVANRPINRGAAMCTCRSVSFVVWVCFAVPWSFSSFTSLSPGGQVVWGKGSRIWQGKTRDGVGVLINVDADTVAWA